MTDWIVCSFCGLRHTARADGSCPRCRALGTGAGWAPPPAEPAAGAPPPVNAFPEGAGAQPAPLPAPGRTAATGSIALPAVPAEEPFPLGARLAGWVLYGNVLLAIVAMIATDSSPFDAKSGFGGPVPLIIDLVVATFLVAGRDKSRGIALARVVLGALILTPMLWANGGPLLGLMQLCFSTGLLLLLVGRAGAVRMAVGGTVSAAVLLLGLAVVTNPAAAGAARGALADVFDRGDHVQQVEGIGRNWRLSLPPGHWHEETPERNSGVERAFVWHEVDAATFVSVHPLPAGSGEVDLNAAADAVTGVLRKEMKTFEEHERHQFDTGRGSAVSLRATMSKDGMTAQGWLVIHAGAGQLGTVLAIANVADAPEVLEELLEVGSALELGDAGVEGSEPAAEEGAGEDAGAEEGDGGADVEGDGAASAEH